MCTRKRQVEIAVRHGNALNATSKVYRNSARPRGDREILAPIDWLPVTHLLRVLLKN